VRQQIPLNGAIAYREGCTLDDNPFDKEKDFPDWDHWRKQFRDEQDRRVGPAR